MKINEIFYSLQGEGFWTGRAAVFVRFSGCNLRCSFCDTAHLSGTEMTEDEICEAVGQFPKEAMVVLTGGEPALFVTERLIALLKARGRYIAIETNGTVANPALNGIDWITFSPKFGFPGGCSADDIKLQKCDELKVVYTGQDLAVYSRFSTPHRFLQPCGVDNVAQNRANMAATVQAVLANPSWRLSLQTHKILSIR